MLTVLLSFRLLRIRCYAQQHPLLEMSLTSHCSSEARCTTSATYSWSPLLVHSHRILFPLLVTPLVSLIANLLPGATSWPTSLFSLCDHVLLMLSLLVSYVFFPKRTTRSLRPGRSHGSLLRSPKLRPLTGPPTLIRSVGYTSSYTLNGAFCLSGIR